MWTAAKGIIDKKIILKNDNFLGEPLKGFADSERLKRGYYKYFERSLVGSRITFEIPFER